MSRIMNTIGLVIHDTMQHMLSFISRVGEKIGEIFQYPLGWIAGLGLLIADAVSDGKFIIYIVVIASVIDLICGIAVSVKNKRFTQSELMRQTVEKLVVYGLALFVFLCIDKVIETETSITMDITSGLVGIVITLTETWSFLASLLILYPNNALLKILQKQLTGELARKLNCEESEVAAILNASRKKASVKRDNKGRFIKK